MADTFFFALEALTTVKWRDAFEREGFSSRIVAIAVDEAYCVKVVSLYPMDLVNFALFLIHTHRRSRGLGGMIKKL